jgi:L-iditol 2-dehydrogenase
LKAFGAKETIVVDLKEDRRSKALQLGADRVVDPGSCDVTAWIHQEYGPDGIDVSFDCVGVAATVNTAIRINRKGTRVVVVGVFEQDATISMGLVQDREIELVGTLMYRKVHFTEAIELLSTSIDGKQMITHHLPMAKINEAFNILVDSKSNAVKVLLTP